MEQEEELVLYQAYGLVKMKIYSYTNEERINYFGILEHPEQESTLNLDSDKITVKIAPRIKRTLENKISFSQLVNLGKPLICLVYPKTTEDFKLRRFRIKNIYLDESEEPPNLNLFRIRGRVNYINIKKQRIIIRIVPKSSKLREFDMGIKCQDIKHELENIELGQFWEIYAELFDNTFRLKSASMIKEKNENYNTTDIISHTHSLKSKLVDIASDKTDNNTSLVVTQVAPTVETHVEASVASNKTKKKKSKASDVVIQEAPVTEVQLVSVAENKTENTNTAPVSETQLISTVIEQLYHKELIVICKLEAKLQSKSVVHYHKRRLLPIKRYRSK